MKTFIAILSLTISMMVSVTLSANTGDGNRKSPIGGDKTKTTIKCSSERPAKAHKAKAYTNKHQMAKGSPSKKNFHKKQYRIKKAR